MRNALLALAFSVVLGAGSLVVAPGGHHGGSSSSPNSAEYPVTITTAGRIAMHVSDDTHSGFLSSSDHAAFSSAVEPNPVVYGTGGYTIGSGAIDTTGTLWGDTFTRADGAIAGTLPEFPDVDGFSGGVWIGNTGNSGAPGAWNVTSNQLRSSANANGTMVFADSGLADATLSLTVAVLDTTSAPTLIFRVNSAGTHFWMLQWYAGTYYLQKCTAAPPSLACTVVGSGATAFVAGDSIVAAYAGSAIVAKRNGTTVVTATDSTYSTQTGAGVFNALDVSGVNRFTNLRAIGSTDTRTVVTSGGTFAIALGREGRGFNHPGVKVSGPANTGEFEVTLATVLDSSLLVQGLAPRPSCNAQWFNTIGSVGNGGSNAYAGISCVGAAAGDRCMISTDDGTAPAGGVLFAQGDGANTVVVTVLCVNGAGCSWPNTSQLITCFRPGTFNP